MGRAKVKLGKKYRDTVSGFEGTATAKYEYMNGCVRYELTREGLSSEHKVVSQVFDEETLETVSGSKPTPTSKSGGPRSDPPSQGAH